MKWRQGFVAIGAVVALLVLVFAAPVFAVQSASDNYGVDEVFFGAGGELNACGNDYCAKQSAGEIAAGNTAGDAFRAVGGFNTERQPYLAFSVAGSNTDLGYLSESTTAIAEATFAVKTYLASGYVVQLASDPPTNTAPSGYMLNALSTPTASSAGTEQFGINLRQNTIIGCGAPANFGNDPVQVPDNTFSFGTVDADYNTCGLFKYVQGDIVASSDRSSGETDYTISFIYNIDDLTPDGEYIFSGSLVATSTF